MNCWISVIIFCQNDFSIVLNETLSVTTTLMRKIERPDEARACDRIKRTIGSIMLNTKPKIRIQTHK